MNDSNDMGYSARGAWIVEYLKWRNPLNSKHRLARREMRRIRREAALERALEASQREVKRLQEWIDYENIVYPDE